MPEKNHFDVVVVGAGPAGSMAALHAVRGGCSVALVERKEKVGIPVRCGEAVGLRGFSASLALDDAWILASVKKIRMVSPGGVSVDLINIGENYVLNREIMDRDLADRAVAAGATFFGATPILSVKAEPGNKYRISGPGGDLYGSCVILADGVESRLARDAGWDTALAPDDIESCAFCRVTHESIRDDSIEFHVGRNVTPGGFAWVFPRGSHTANVGLGALGSMCTSGLAKERLKAFIERNYPGATIHTLHCGGVPVGRWLKPLVKNGVMVAGDAARQVNSLSGAGITYALFAGKAAGETVAEAKRAQGMDWAHLHAYERKWAAYCGKQQMRSYALKSMLLKNDNDAFYDSVARSLAKEPPERLTYMRVFFRTFARHPLMLLKTFFLFR